MTNSKKYLAKLLSIFNFGSDVGISIISAVVLANILNQEFTFTWLVFSILFSLAPDIDILVELPLVAVKKVKPNSIHRAYTHHPLFYYAGGLVLLLINFNYGVLFIVNTTFHFLHDSIGTAWGISWLYPIHSTYYKFFADNRGVIAKNLVQKWTPAEREFAIKTYGDVNWIVNLYCNSWRLSNFITTESGPPIEFLSESYSKARWFFASEIVLTFTGFLVLVSVVI